MARKEVGVKITTRWLEKVEACTTQIARFSALFPEGAEVTYHNLILAYCYHLDTRWLAWKILKPKNYEEWSMVVYPKMDELEDQSKSIMIKVTEGIRKLERELHTQIDGVQDTEEVLYTIDLYRKRMMDCTDKFDPQRDLIRRQEGEIIAAEIMRQINKGGISRKARWAWRRK